MALDRCILPVTTPDGELLGVARRDDIEAEIEARIKLCS